MQTISQTSRLILVVNEGVSISNESRVTSLEKIHMPSYKKYKRFIQ